MARDVDLTDPDSWDDDDIRYLGDRALLKGEDLDRYRELVAAPEDMPLEERANTGDANTKGVTKEEHERQVAALAQEDEDDDDDEEDDEDEGLEPPYEEYRNEDLRAEIVRRAELKGETPDLDGRKVDLVARLEAMDAEDEE